MQNLKSMSNLVFRLNVFLYKDVQIGFSNVDFFRISQIIIVTFLVIFKNIFELTNCFYNNCTKKLFYCISQKKNKENFF